MAPPLAHRRSPGDQRAAPFLLLRLLATTTIRLLRLPTPPTSLSLAVAGAKVIEMVEESGRVLCGLTFIRDAGSQEPWDTPLCPRSGAPPPPPAGERRV